MELSAVTKSINDLFSVNKQYVVPNFQREYSWGQEEIEELWKDIVRHIKKTEIELIPQEYFIGSLVLIGKEGDKTLQIVDGQQRFTTITILLAAIVKTFRSIGRYDLSDGVQQYIEGRDLSSRVIFKLVNETPRPYFQNRIQAKEKNESLSPVTQEEKNIGDAYDFFVKQLGKDGLSAVFEEIHQYPVTTENYVDSVCKIRDQVLNLKTIYITVNNEDEAYTIFETLNARGLGLGPIDLIKNETYRVLKDDRPDDNVRPQWKRLKEILTSRDSRVDIEVFFRHFWLSQFEFCTEANIYKSFKELIHPNPEQMKEFLSQLLVEADNYKKITNPGEADWPQMEEKSVYSSYQALNIFRVTQPRTLLLALMEQRKARKITLQDFLRCISGLEHFHFVFSAVCSSRASGLEGRYSKYARAIRKCQTQAESAAVIAEILDGFRDKIPAKSVFLESFQLIEFSKEEPRFKKLIQYMFKKHELFLRRTSELTIGEMSIEHIIPEETRGTNPDVLKIGNLLPLSLELNNEADNKSLELKYPIYQRSELKTVESFMTQYPTTNKFASELISARTEALGSLYYDEIFKIN